MSLITNHRLLHNIHCIVLVHTTLITIILHTYQELQSFLFPNRIILWDCRIGKKFRRLNFTAVVASSSTEQDILIFYSTTKVNRKKIYNFRSEPQTCNLKLSVAVWQQLHKLSCITSNTRKKTFHI